MLIKTMKPSFKDLLDNIDSFIRRYYLNKLIKGILLFVSGLLLSFFITISLEYFFEFNKEFRKFLFFTYFTINTIILLSTVIIPWLYFTRIIHGINKEKAAIIIGRYFVNINDQLTNTLQLKSQINQNNTDLVEASILQKIKNVNSNQFSKAIKLKDNIKFLPYLMVIILTFIVTYFVSPNFLIEPTNRIINYSSEYKPFYFKYNTENYTIEEGENVEVKVELVGKKIPNQVFIESSLGKFLMKKVQKNVFTYTFIKVKSDVKFRFYSQDYYSNEIKINVYGRAIVNRYDAHITYPKYLNMNNEKIKNFGNIQAPEGSQIKFIVSTKNTENNRLTINNKKVIFKESIKQSITLKNDVFLKLLFRNSYSNT